MNSGEEIKCNQLAVLTVQANNQTFRRAEEVFVSHFSIDKTFVEIKAMPRNIKFRNLEPQDAIKLWLKREKPILFNE